MYISGTVNYMQSALSSDDVSGQEVEEEENANEETRSQKSHKHGGFDGDTNIYKMGKSWEHNNT